MIDINDILGRCLNFEFLEPRDQYLISVLRTLHQLGIICNVFKIIQVNINPVRHFLYGFQDFLSSFLRI